MSSQQSQLRSIKSCALSKSGGPAAIPWPMIAAPAGSWAFPVSSKTREALLKGHTRRSCAPGRSLAGRAATPRMLLPTAAHAARTGGVAPREVARAVGPTRKRRRRLAPREVAAARWPPCARRVAAAKTGGRMVARVAARRVTPRERWRAAAKVGRRTAASEIAAARRARRLAAGEVTLCVTARRAAHAGAGRSTPQRAWCLGPVAQRGARSAYPSRRGHAARPGTCEAPRRLVHERRWTARRRRWTADVAPRSHGRAKGRGHSRRLGQLVGTRVVLGFHAVAAWPPWWRVAVGRHRDVGAVAGVVGGCAVW
jgi:hypothetical protein